MFTGEKQATYGGGDLSVWPDDFTLRSCVTTVADAGSSGWRSFEDFKKRVAASKFGTMPKFAKSDSGYLALQGDHGQVSFRNIKIRSLGK